MRRAPALQDRLHRVLDHGGIPGDKLEHDLKDDLGTRKVGCAVVPRDVAARVMHKARTRAEDYDLRNDGVHPMVGCARVHRDGTAHGAGNAHCEL